MKWTYLGDADLAPRFQVLADALREKGVENEFEIWPHQSLNFETYAEIADYKHVRLTRQWAMTLARNIKLQSSWTSLLGVSDGMVNTGTGWWPLCALYEAFGQLLATIGSDLVTTHSALIAGAGGSARTAVAALFKTGFRQFLITHTNEAEGEAMVREVSSRFFGLNIKFVPREKIVTLSGETSLFVNCTPQADENAILSELCYLNFLKRPGIYIDLSLHQKPHQLLLEAIDSGVQVHRGDELAARSDVLWAKWAFHCDLELNSYREFLLEKLGLERAPILKNS
jgi:hypothetical protein